MLRELTVQNLALIEDVQVELEPGFCAWTGETGAGKTLLLTALGLLMGERGNSDLLRSGKDEARIFGRFEINPNIPWPELEQVLGGPPEDNEILLMRRLNQSGRSSAYINELPVSVGTLRQIGTRLINIHGQRESHSLLEPAYQLEQLDAFGNLESYREAYLECAEKVRAIRRRYRELIADQQQRQRELSLVRFEREELDNADLKIGELEELTRERELLAHSLSLCTFAENSCNQLYDEEGSVYEILGKLVRDAQKWRDIDDHIAEIGQRLDNLCSEARDITDTLRDLSQTWQADPERAEFVEERLQTLRKLESKYGQTIDALIEYRITLDVQEAKLQGEENDLAGIETQLEEAWQALMTTGEDLSQQRRKVAKKLASAVQKHLADLGMKDATIDAELERIKPGTDPREDEIPSYGFEQLDILLAANRGEPARPLRKVASGGEMSRTMLALKSVLAAKDQVGTLVFDEIDSNVGGRLGDVLGQKLSNLGHTHQIICVTHLPQVASYATHQWTIRKGKRGKRTSTTIELLNESNRVDELASMMRGESKGETTRQEAEAMLSAAREQR